jgi:hypothetical protein
MLTIMRVWSADMPAEQPMRAKTTSKERGPLFSKLLQTRISERLSKMTL